MITIWGAGDTSRSRSRGRIIAPRSGGDPVILGEWFFEPGMWAFFLPNDELFETQNPKKNTGFLGVLSISKNCLNEMIQEVETRQEVQYTRSNLRHTKIYIICAFDCSFTCSQSFCYDHDFTPKTGSFDLHIKLEGLRLVICTPATLLEPMTGVQIFWRREWKAKSRNMKHYSCKRSCEEWWCSVQVFWNDHNHCVSWVEEDRRYQDESCLIPKLSIFAVFVKVVCLLPHTSAVASPTPYSDETNPSILELMEPQRPGGHLNPSKHPLVMKILSLHRQRQWKSRSFPLRC